MQQLRDMWAEGKSTDFIADIIGVKRAAITFKVKTMGLPRRRGNNNFGCQAKPPEGFDINNEAHRRDRLEKTPYREENGVRVYECPTAWGFPSTPRWVK